MQPAKSDFTVYQGATLTKTWTFTVNNVPINWTGWTGKFTIRQYADTTEPAILTLTTGNGITNLTSNGIVAITMTATQTGTIPAGVYVYDCELSSGATVERVLQGRITVDAQVSA